MKMKALVSAVAVAVALGGLASTAQASTKCYALTSIGNAAVNPNGVLKVRMKLQTYGGKKLTTKAEENQQFVNPQKAWDVRGTFLSTTGGNLDFWAAIEGSAVTAAPKGIDNSGYRGSWDGNSYLQAAPAAPSVIPATSWNFDCGTNVNNPRPFELVCGLTATVALGIGDIQIGPVPTRFTFVNAPFDTECGRFPRNVPTILGPVPGGTPADLADLPGLLGAMQKAMQ